MLLLNTPEITGNKDNWSQLEGCGKALAIAEAAQKFNGLSLVITDSVRTAAELEIALDFFVGETLPVLSFPDWETLPYDLFSPHQDIISQRLDRLFNLPESGQAILVVSASTLTNRLPPISFIQGKAFSWHKGQQLDPAKLRRQLVAGGYLQVESVTEHGQYAVRGSLIDLFPMGCDLPVRIDLFDDEIESLRFFDPESQTTLEHTDKIDLLPAREVNLDADGLKLFKDNFLLEFADGAEQSLLYRDISNGVVPQGIEYYLPFFFAATATLFEYLPNHCQILVDGDIQSSVEHFWAEIKQRYEEYGVDRLRPLVPPAKLFISSPELFHLLGNFRKVRLHDSIQQNSKAHFAIERPHGLSIDVHQNNPASALKSHLEIPGRRTLFCAESDGRRQVLEELLQKAGIKTETVTGWQDFLEQTHIAIAIAVHPIGQGMLLKEQQITLVTEAELFGYKVLQSRRRQSNRGQGEQVFQNLTELRLGSPVVHLEHGVGRYRGLTTLTVDKEPQEFLTLEYANQAQLYVPVASLGLISRYSGVDDDLAPLHHLGSDKWQKSKEKAVRKLRDTAAELLEIYAQRAARKGFSVNAAEQDYLSFCSDFPFEETPDQEQAIALVRKDLAASSPMDRLVCGDVGFGKTEVAMRAAFIAVSAGRQVVMLVPTTLLAHQHTENFRDRFANWPVRIEELSRFRNQREQQEIIAAVNKGKVDILIGTHKLLNTALDYPNLGLLIIDEEHRFGVTQKEKIMALRSKVDILTMTATPIPRTLNMSLAGMRDLSIIATPPAKRLAVKTFVREQEPRLIKEALLREILRGGQVYYLHNDVKSIERAAHELQQLVPEARIAVGHGQMRERQLEKVMGDFYHQRFNVLVCTTIIETGIDIPSANTIIIHRADKFGLAQLHQLRGRVGRSHHQAYAYLLTPDAKSMTADALKRLEAIEAADQLGAGFTLATHDMEIRGAGELLGSEQSGHIQAIGFSLFMALLDRAVKALQQGKDIETDLPLMEDTEINLNIPALIPDGYLPDVHTRLVMYKRIANAESENDLQELKVEMIDRFGLLPEYLKNLFRVATLKLEARTLGIDKIEVNRAGGKISFSSQTRVDPMLIVQLVQQAPQVYRLEGASSLKFSASLDTIEQRFSAVQQLLDQFNDNR